MAPNKSASISGVINMNESKIYGNSTEIPSDTTPDSDSSLVIILVDSADATHDIFDTSDGQSPVEDVEELQSENEIVEPETINNQEIIPHVTKWTAHHPISLKIGDPSSSVRTRSATANECNFSMFLSTTEPT